MNPSSLRPAVSIGNFGCLFLTQPERVWKASKCAVLTEQLSLQRKVFFLDCCSSVCEGAEKSGMSQLMEQEFRSSDTDEGISGLQVQRSHGLTGQVVVWCTHARV